MKYDVGNFHDYHNYFLKGVVLFGCVLDPVGPFSDIVHPRPLLPVLVKVGVGWQGRRQSRRALLPADLTVILLLTLPDEVGDGAGVEDVLAVHSHMTSAREHS